VTAVVFDTLKFVEKLEAAGVSHAQAKATAEATGQELVTKSDLAAAKADIASTRAELREVELRMTVKLGGLIVGAVGVILAAIRYLPAGH
jgi:hypothetical protein